MKKIVLSLIGIILLQVIINFFNYSYFILVVSFLGVIFFVTISIILSIKNDKEEWTIVSKVCSIVFCFLFTIVFSVLLYRYYSYFLEVKQIEKYMMNSKEIMLNDKIIKKDDEFRKEFIKQLDLVKGQDYSFSGEFNQILKNEDDNKLYLYTILYGEDCDVYVFVKKNKVIPIRGTQKICKYF